VNDDLLTSCTFYWQLKEEDQITESLNPEMGEPQIIHGRVIAEGNTTMSGADYDNWDGSNDYAFNYIAKQINVTIL
jgi:hypothetical protein